LDPHRSIERSPSFYTRGNQIILEGLLFTFSFASAFWLRFEGWPPDSAIKQFLLWLPILILARIASHFALGIYRRVWRFVSISDAVEITKSIAVVSVALVALRFATPGTGALSDFLRLPISVIVLEALLSLTAAFGIRVLRRLHYSFERKSSASSQPAKRVLLYGAGRAGIMLRKEMENSNSYDVVGFIDDDPFKVGSVISDTKVLGDGDQLEKLASVYHIDEIIISMATASRATLAKALARCRRAQLVAKIIPSLQEILSGQVQISQLRDTRVEEVLGRDSIEVRDFEQVAGPTYRGKRILVTGAGGSIGTELVRQLTRLNPAKIAILDKDENSIYELEQELLRHDLTFAVEPQIADVRDAGRLRALFSDFQPQAVFHAAAHKHVPLMEAHPCEAILNNVGGLKNILDVSSEFRVERFVFISSDKAVNPCNIMGATKRVGEMLVQSQLSPNPMRFACVRFGNVLGSRGSVIPLFKKQIAEGGPVTVTHQEMTRYFMTIPEAVQLILCAGTLARRGEIFVLDMGEPRNILELAREMILLSGFEPERDIHTTITGLRPGEKLTEELVASTESLSPTSLEKLSLIEPQFFDKTSLLLHVNHLLHAARGNDHHRIIELLHLMGMGFQGTTPALLATAVAASQTSRSVLSIPSPNPGLASCQESTI
jgi:FlaA1/EpsC-like NDP-sugar epimerase